jgi:hypothetical protein
MTAPILDTNNLGFFLQQKMVLLPSHNQDKASSCFSLKKEASFFALKHGQANLWLITSTTCSIRSGWLLRGLIWHLSKTGRESKSRLWSAGIDAVSSGASEVRNDFTSFRVTPMHVMWSAGGIADLWLTGVMIVWSRCTSQLDLWIIVQGRMDLFN